MKHGPPVPITRVACIGPGCKASASYTAARAEGWRRVREGRHPNEPDRRTHFWLVSRVCDEVHGRRMKKKAQKLMRRNERMRAALIKLASKLKSARSQIERLNVENQLLSEVALNARTWLEANTRCAHLAAEVAGFKLGNVGARGPKAYREELNYEDEQEKIRKKYGRS